MFTNPETRTLPPADTVMLAATLNAPELGPARIPSEAQCRAMWQCWDLPEHIQEHSLLVSRVARQIAEFVARDLVPRLDIDLVVAASLLHDVAKFYTIQHGGSHSQIGAAWVLEQTGNPILARAVLHHVNWPFGMDLSRYPVGLIVCYSDKRVRHTEIVDLRERFADLQDRYGKTARARVLIQESLEQGQALEDLLNRELKVDLNAYSFDCRRMVG